jgi:hypothetical protein
MTTNQKESRCRPGGCASIGCEGGHYCFRPDSSPIVASPEQKEALRKALDQMFKRKD